MEQNKNGKPGGTRTDILPPDSEARQAAERMSKAAMESRGKGALMVIDSEPPVSDNTTLMLYTVKTAAVDNGIPTAIFTPAMTNTEAVNRLLSIATGVEQGKISSGKLSDDDWMTLTEGLPGLVSAPLYIDDTPEIALEDLESRIADLKADRGVRLVVVCPVTEVSVTQEVLFEYEPVQYKEHELQRLAEELGITVIAVEK